MLLSEAKPGVRVKVGQWLGVIVKVRPNDWIDVLYDVGKTVVPGHGLRYEGAPCVARDCCASDGNHGNRNPYDSQGHAFCSCGAVSPCLSSTGWRKRWHREHKAAVVAGAVEGQRP